MRLSSPIRQEFLTFLQFPRSWLKKTFLGPMLTRSNLRLPKANILIARRWNCWEDKARSKSEPEANKGHHNA